MARFIVSSLLLVFAMVYLSMAANTPKRPQISTKATKGRTTRSNPFQARNLLPVTDLKVDLCATKHLKLPYQNFSKNPKARANFEPGAFIQADQVDVFPVNIGVVFKVVCPPTSPTCPPDVITQAIDKQLDSLNDAFGKWNIYFSKLKATSGDRNNAVFYAKVPEPDSNGPAASYFAANMHPNPRVLTVFIKDLQNYDVNGFTNRQGWTNTNRCNRNDYIVIDWRRLPNMTGSSYGRTLVHEVGHYLGLEHTFRGGCASGNSDFLGVPYVDDTVALEDVVPTAGSGDRLTYALKCQARTCSGNWLRTNNLMSFVPDNCRDSFTPNQAKAMRYNYFACRMNL